MRTLQEIKNNILAEKALHPTLNVLDNTSPTSIWLLWVNIIAYAIWLHEAFFDKHVSHVETIAARAIPNTLPWYHYQALQYQHGYMLEWNASTLRYEYTTIDLSARIIALCAVIEGQDSIILKVVKKTTSLTPLTNTEKNAFSTYINRLKTPGVSVFVISENADEIRIYADVYYNGTLPLTTVRASVETAINAYLESLPFDGKFQLSKLQDAIQQATGVTDVALGNIQARFGTSAFQSIVLDYHPYSGYFTLATPLAGTINYIAQ